MASPSPNPQPNPNPNRDYGVPGDGGGVFCEFGVPAPYPDHPSDGDNEGCINE